MLLVGESSKYHEIISNTLTNYWLSICVLLTQTEIKTKKNIHTPMMMNIEQLLSRKLWKSQSWNFVRARNGKFNLLEWPCSGWHAERVGSFVYTICSFKQFYSFRLPTNYMLISITFLTFQLMIDPFAFVMRKQLGHFKRVWFHVHDKYVGGFHVRR